MKHLNKLLVCLFLFFTIRSNATLCTAVANGDWSSPATWSCGRAPQSGDTIWIPLGFTVQVDINSPVYNPMLIVVDGNLFFDVGQKINICPGGVYVSPTGSLGSGNPGSKVNICGSTVWNGPDTINGPASLGDVILPVELMSFTGVLQSNGFVALEWSTASESNNSHFTIERSTNGMTFVEIGRVVGHGTSSQQNDYTMADPNPESGANYYRLKQTDYNGHYEYLSIVVVEVNTTAGGCVLTVFPNPCQGMCTVNFSDCPNDNNGSITLQVIDATGQLVSETVPQRDAEGGFVSRIDATNNLKPGLYIVRGVSSKATYTQNVVMK